MEIDGLDRTIIEVLNGEGRISIPALADRVGTSRATAYARFDRLVENGVLRGFHADIDPRALGFDVAALLMVTGDQTKWQSITAALRETYGVDWVGMCAGQYDFAVLVRARDLSELRDVVLDSILRVSGVTNIESTVLFDEFGKP